MPAQNVTHIVAPGSGARRLGVLLVEDNADDALLLERHLRRNGFAPDVHRVETESEMRSALTHAARFQVVLADYNLPMFSGPAALQMLKVSGIDLPFIMMSGAISEETAVESMRAGAQDYVIKHNLTRLVPALERELKEAEARGQQVAAERALTASEARFHRLVEAMPLGLVISNVSGQVIYANAAIERLLGYAAGALTSGTIKLETLLPTLGPTLNDCGMPGAAIHPVESTARTAEGRDLEILVGAALLNPEAARGDCQVAAFIADLSIQKKSEEVLRRTEKLAVAGRLAASIAHEINNPLEAITNCLYLLSGTALTEEGRTYLEMGQRELDRVAQITVQTLKFYRGSTRPIQTDINELFESVLILFESRLRQNNIHVAREYAPEARVLAYDGEIRQVIVNLIGNALDALVGGGRLTVRTEQSRDWKTGAEGVRFSVADTGMGMSPATQLRIFEPFFSTKGITGTGLGLWVSREIVDRHSGHLHVRSRKRREGCAGGTVFSVFVPAADSPESLTRLEVR